MVITVPRLIASTCNLLSCVISIPLTVPDRDSEPVPVTPGERNPVACLLEVPGVRRFIHIRRISSTRGSGCSTFILALALWSRWREEQTALSRWRTRTGPDVFLHAGHVQDVYFRHHFFNRLCRLQAIPFSSSISRMYCGMPAHPAR